MMLLEQAIHQLQFLLHWAWHMLQGKKGRNRHVVAVIGDGAMTAGQAFEGLE